MLHILVSRALSRFVRRLYRRALGGYTSTRPRPRHQGITKWINVGKPKPFSSLSRVSPFPIQSRRQTQADTLSPHRCKQCLSARTIWKFCLLEWVLQLGLLDNGWTKVVEILLPIHRDLASVVDDRFCICKAVFELGCEAFDGDIEEVRYIL
jgi:hypothetical protein